MSRFLLVRTLVTVAVFSGLLVTAGPRRATAWTVYGDVIVEVASPTDPRLLLRPR